ncbi:Hint domain-containing protein [Sedimentimonas flavescens]|uniref:Hint domain-containing protein n=1 Tax=Sedimentimonas flavescens TaxID=2851012 RepID=UPI0021A398CD|nr:Hint domain-containing protein [Sedimentimonas flavescens]MCT2539237.1 Hint domain-containing protein [Sedimentimonas flavescens]
MAGLFDEESGPGTEDDGLFERPRSGEAADNPYGAGLAEGIAAGTRIATEDGWRRVETINPGERVLTFDHGPRRVQQIMRATLSDGCGHCPPHMLPLEIPPGVLGNAEAMMLLPEQIVLIESDLAETLYDDPFAFIPAAALEGYRGAARIAPQQPFEVIFLQFEDAEVVYANGAGMILCGAADGTPLDALMEGRTDYRVLPLDKARRLVEALIEDERAE